MSNTFEPSTANKNLLESMPASTLQEAKTLAEEIIREQDFAKAFAMGYFSFDTLQESLDSVNWEIERRENEDA